MRVFLRIGTAFASGRLRFPSGKKVNHPIFRSDDNQTSGTIPVGRVTNRGIEARTSSSVTNDSSMHTDPPVKDDTDCVASAINIQKHRPVDICQRRHEGWG